MSKNTKPLVERKVFWLGKWIVDVKMHDEAMDRVKEQCQSIKGTKVKLRLYNNGVKVGESSIFSNHPEQWFPIETIRNIFVDEKDNAYLYILTHKINSQQATLLGFRCETVLQTSYYVEQFEKLQRTSGAGWALDIAETGTGNGTPNISMREKPGKTRKTIESIQVENDGSYRSSKTRTTKTTFQDVQSGVQNGFESTSTIVLPLGGSSPYAEIDFGNRDSTLNNRQSKMDYYESIDISEYRKNRDSIQGHGSSSGESSKRESQNNDVVISNNTANAIVPAGGVQVQIGGAGFQSVASSSNSSASVAQTQVITETKTIHHEQPVVNSQVITDVIETRAIQQPIEQKKEERRTSSSFQDLASHVASRVGKINVVEETRQKPVPLQKKQLVLEVMASSPPQQKEEKEVVTEVVTTSQPQQMQQHREVVTEVVKSIPAVHNEVITETISRTQQPEVQESHSTQGMMMQGQQMPMMMPYGQQMFMMPQMPMQNGESPMAFMLVPVGGYNNQMYQTNYQTSTSTAPAQEATRTITTERTVAQPETIVNRRYESHNERVLQPEVRTTTTTITKQQEDDFPPPPPPILEEEPVYATVTKRRNEDQQRRYEEQHQQQTVNQQNTVITREDEVHSREEEERVRHLQQNNIHIQQQAEEQERIRKLEMEQRQTQVVGMQQQQGVNQSERTVITREVVEHSKEDQERINQLEMQLQKMQLLEQELLAIRNKEKTVRTHEREVRSQGDQNRIHHLENELLQLRMLLNQYTLKKQQTVTTTNGEVKTMVNKHDHEHGSVSTETDYQWEEPIFGPAHQRPEIYYRRHDFLVGRKYRQIAPRSLSVVRPIDKVYVKRQLKQAQMNGRVNGYITHEQLQEEAKSRGEPEEFEISTPVRVKNI